MNPEAIIIKHTPIKRSEKEKAAMKALQVSIEKARIKVNQALCSILFCLCAFPAFSQSVHEVIMDPEPKAPVVFYDYMSNQDCYTLNEEWILHPYTGQEWAGYWQDGFFYSDDQRFYFTADAAYQEHWPSIDLWNEEDFNPPSLYTIVYEHASPKSANTMFKNPHKAAETAKVLSLGLSALAGFCGGMGEGYLSRDGNWDTRSKRSHRWRDASIGFTLGAAFSFGTGCAIEVPSITEFGTYVVVNALTYYGAAQLAYRGVTKHNW